MAWKRSLIYYTHKWMSMNGNYLMLCQSRRSKPEQTNGMASMYKFKREAKRTVERRRMVDSPSSQR